MLAVAILGAASIGSPSPARANPFDAYGFGARAIGLGGAATALADDFSANHYNPAGLTVGDGLELAFGYFAAAPRLTLNGRDLAVDDANGTQFGATLRGLAFSRKLALSIGLHLPDARITRLRALPELQPRFALFDNHPQRLVLTTSLAFELIPKRLSFGVGLTYLSDTRGRLAVSGAVDLLDAAGTTLISAVDVNFAAVRSPSAGLLWRPDDHLRVGLAFREAFDLSLDIGVIVDGDIITGGATDTPTPLVEDAMLAIVSRNANLFTPRQLALGVAWSEDAWTLSLDCTWMHYAAFVSPTAYLTTELDAGDLPLAIPPNPRPLAPRFHDVLVPRLGVEGRLASRANVDLVARAGLSWEPSPAPVQRGATNLADSDKVSAGLGMSLTFRDLTEVLPRPFHLDLAARLVHLLPRAHLKDDPADPIGDYTSGGTIGTFAAHLRFEL
jgi:long-subunit fatty acid transport protein